VRARNISVPGPRYLRPPARRSVPLVGDVPRLLTDPLSAFLTTWRQCGDVVRFRVAPRRAYLVVHPDNVRHVLHKQRMIYRRDRLHTVWLEELVGGGLTASEGPLWSEQRSLLRPVFHSSQNAKQARATVLATTRMLERWATVDSGKTIDLHREMLRVSLEAIFEGLFSVNIEREAPRIVSAAAVVFDHLYCRMRIPMAGMSRLLTPAGPNVDAAKITLYDFAARLLEQGAHRSSGVDALAILAGYNDLRLAQDQIVTIILAGHDTTGTALAWAGHLIATHPKIDRRMNAEAREYTTALLDEMLPLTYARGVFRETLRLYPPAWVLSRTPNRSDEMDVYTIAEGSTIFVCPFITHRHPAFWVDAEQFEPERFTNTGEARHPYAYLPFGAGPRMCIGKAFAETIGQIVISMIARSYRLIPASQQPVVPRPRLTLHPQRGMHMRLLAR
jgi:cytochrome P450